MAQRTKATKTKAKEIRCGGCGRPIEPGAAILVSAGSLTDRLTFKVVREKAYFHELCMALARGTPKDVLAQLRKQAKGKPAPHAHAAHA